MPTNHIKFTFGSAWQCKSLVLSEGWISRTGSSDQLFCGRKTDWTREVGFIYIYICTGRSALDVTGWIDANDESYPVCGPATRSQKTLLLRAFDFVTVEHVNVTDY